ncbi:MAG: hypothetical protein ABIN24_15400, partial [Dyadobacter sp.]
MRSKKTFAVLSLLFFVAITLSCNNSASDAKEATERLVNTDKWLISEIDANDAPVFKDGKLVQQFGGPSFERYMENVRFNKDGTFSGYFKGETNPMILKWKTNDKNITVFSADAAAAKGGEWTIDPKDVFKNTF